uniref:Uncharacterized protein n=1 Tax=Anguilla anguilla TaxID=7936 RepID=A0A0E9URA5_ANGAN
MTVCKRNSLYYLYFNAFLLASHIMLHR